MPPGMRDTLYFKDDDTRLSFLQGNYVTLTNMKEEDLKRIIHYHLAPINISVHATNPELRCRMLHNRFAGDILDKIQMLYDAGIEMNAQIVLCKGVNDGAELERSIEELFAFYPHMQSLSVVPVGLTKYREGLEPLEPFEQQDAREVLSVIHKWQNICYEKTGAHFVQASDEWYLVADMDLPAEERYDGYIQLENGVGMLRLLTEEFRQALKKEHRRPFMKAKEVSIATGRLAAPFMEQLCREFMQKFPKVKIHVYAIRNDFFGERITVSGLITGQDLIAQLQGVPLGEKLWIPQNMIRSKEQDFLDDVTLEEVNKTLQVPVDIVKSSGQAFVKAMLS
jgi:putative radical SAM enzyme (TIGR03279 family)